MQSVKAPTDIEFVTSLETIEQQAWDNLIQQDDPFAEHGFLLALEQSGSVGPGTGWSPAHVVLRGPTGNLRGALPLYVKHHSYGEYIFDWGWAGAAHRGGLEYYPKLVSMAPLTPATGQRILYAPEETLASVVGPLLAGVRALLTALGASSVHLLFLTAEELDAVQDADQAYMRRLSMQYHWSNTGYTSFDDYLSHFRASLRKQVRKERKRAADSGLDIRVLESSQLQPSDYAALRDFYMDTCHKRGSGPYLTADFFDRLQTMPHNRVVAVLAYDGDQAVAGTLNFQRGKRLYGRYWGCVAEYDALHFECCYYRLIERAIALGLDHFEAGAQGTHKLRRGLLPAAIHSAHLVVHPGLRQAVAEYLPQEALSVQQEMEALAEHGPFKRGEG